MKPLAGKIALVTGASRGIGRATAESLAREGASVVVNYHSNKDEAEACVAAVRHANRDAGGDAIAVQGDISNVEQVRGLFDATIAKFGKLHILVNNAYPATPRGPIAELSMAAFDNQFNGLRGNFVAMQEAAKRMEDGGSIVNVTTGMTHLWAPNASLYTASKAGLEQFTRALSKEIGPRGINVNSVAPGLTDTDRVKGQVPGRSAGAGGGAGMPMPTGAHVPGKSQFDRMGTAQEVAEAIVFLCLPSGHWINGQFIGVNGGTAMS